MTVTTPARPSTAARRVGYLAAASINAVLLYLIAVSPGWQAVPFLTDDTTRVLGLVELSVVVGVFCNLLYTVADPLWLRASGALVTTAVGLVVLTRLWQVFPFEFDERGVDWAWWIRLALVVGVVGSVIGLIAHTVNLVRACAAHRPEHRPRRLP